MKFRSMKKLIAAAMAAAMTVGSVSVAPPVEVKAEEGTPAISAQVAADTKGMKVTWNKLENDSVTGYRVYRKEAGNTVTSDNGELIATLDNEGNSAKTWKYDFGLDKTTTEEGETVSYVQDGYIGVTSENATYTKEQGYGFTEGIPAVGTLAFKSGSKLSGDILNGDFVIIEKPATGDLNTAPIDKIPSEGQSYIEFVQDLPNGEYEVTVTHVGDNYTGILTTATISVQGIFIKRYIEKNFAVVESKTSVTDATNGKLTIWSAATGGGAGIGTAALSAVTITEIPKIKTGIDGDSFYCNDVTADESKKYTYKVVAMEGENEVANLNSGTVQPVTAPTVSVDTTTTASATLKINNNGLDADSYNIYRKKASDDTFTKTEFSDIKGEGKYDVSSVYGEKNVFVNDNFNSYTTCSGDDSKSLFTKTNGDWTVTAPVQYYVGTILDTSDAACMSNTDFLKKSVLRNYDSKFMFLCMGNDKGTTFHKKLTAATALEEQTRLKFNFALPNYASVNNGIKDRGVASTYLYLADKEITENDATSGYVAKLEYNVDDNKIYLNDTELYDFGAGADTVRSIWNTITLDINPTEKTISYEFEREAEDYVKRGNVTIPDVPEEPETQDDEGTGEGTGETEEKPSATLSFTSGTVGGYRWGSIAIDNLKFASLGVVSQSKTYTYTDTKLDANTEYNYYVGAVKGGKEVVRSSTVTATTQPIVENSITLSKPNLTLKKGDSSEALTVTFNPENTSIQTITWSSSNSDVAMVTNGVVKGVGPGTATIKATSKNGKEATCTVKVTDVRILDESNKATGNINLKIGKEHQLRAEVRPTDSVTNQNVTWKTDNSAVATVDAQGKVKAIAAGRATITATAANNEETATRTVVVTKENVIGITLSPASSGTLKIGGSVTLIATVEPSDATNQNVKWSSSDNKVATVDNGVVKAVGAGTADITATSDDNPSITATYKLTVQPATVSATNVTLSGSGIKNGKVTLNKGKTLKVTAKMTPSDSTDTLTWDTSKKSVATVNNGTIKAVGKGTAKITVKTTSGKTAQITVTVKVPATKVTVSGKGVKKNKATLNKGKKLDLTAKVTPSGSTDTVKWSVDKKKVATIKVNKKNKNKVTITAKKKGKAVITAKAGKKSVKVTITVK